MDRHCKYKIVDRAQHVEINYTPVTLHKQEKFIYQKLNILNNLGNIYNDTGYMDIFSDKIKIKHFHIYLITTEDYI